MNKKFYVTTPIYYPNDKLHIGHAYTTVLADFIARYKKQHNYEVFFLTGSDEHGQKIDDKAKESGKDTLTYVSEIIETFKSLWTKLGIEHDLFIRTTDIRHKDFVQKAFSTLLEKKYIYKGNYEDFYCKPCESYFTNSQLVENKCPQCQRDVVKMSEESYFLEVTKFKDFVVQLLKEKNILFPKSRVNELINSFLENDFKDLSISRTTFTWGIKVPNNETHVIYVWFDALLNYLSAFSFAEKKSNMTLEQVWSRNSQTEILQIVGKEITRFHAIYWPIILEMLDLRQPRILGHGWILVNNTKMSKSIGNVIDPVELIEKYGRDAVRFFLINNINTGEDGTYSESLLVETYNSILVNKYSNLINRTYTMLEKYFNFEIPQVEIKDSQLIDFQKQLLEKKNLFVDNVEYYKFSDSTKALISFMEILNKCIEVTTPWSKPIEIQKEILKFLFDGIYELNVLISPILIDSTKLFFNSVVNDKTKVVKIDFLFNRI